MKQIIITVLLWILISGCARDALHRSKYFEPSNAPIRSGTVFEVGKFENWDIAVDFFAYYHNSADPENKDNDFRISIPVSTLDREAFNMDMETGVAYKDTNYRPKHRDTNYRPDIKSLRILYGKNLQNEIKIEKIESESKKNGKLIFFSNADGKIYVSPDIKSVTVFIEMEFFDEDGGSTMKTFAVPMKRKEVSFIAPIND